MHLLKTLLLLLLFLMAENAKAQRNIRDSVIAFPMIGATAAFQIPGADMADRFGTNTNVGGVFQWKLRNNLIVGLDGQFIFSDRVKETGILDSLADSKGNIIDDNGRFADIILYERGFKFELKAGKIFPVFGPNPNSGILFTIGAGLLQHKIRIQSQGSNVPSLQGEYAKGYDRLSNGLCFTEFIGYSYFSNSRRVNFYAGFEFTQAFTKNRRDFNYDTRMKDDSERLDLLSGLRLGWVIPLYKQSTKEFYYN